ncbi:DUF2125 domain-containing protein [Aliigemmobacter aestuarii]|nr:DUF2125 domain-containing protein [Gemmobacter aestuarii]
MRAIIWGVAGLTAIYSGYWFVGASAARTAIESQLAGLQAQGLVAETSDLSLRGFPNRFDLTLTDPRFGDPQAGVEWAAPFAQVFSLSYKPWHLIAALPPEQTITLPGDVITLRSDSFKGSLVMEPGTALPLDRMNIAVDALEANASGGPIAGAETLRIATRQEPLAENAHEYAFLATNLRPDPGLMALFASAGLPDVIARANLGGVARFDGPIRPAAPESLPVLTGLSVDQADLVWGDLTVTAKGELRPDAAGLAEGTLTVEVTGWRVLPAALQAAGVIQPDALFVVTAMLSGMAQQDGTPETLTLPLSFANGMTVLGTWPLGPAPRLR